MKKSFINYILRLSWIVFCIAVGSKFGLGGIIIIFIAAMLGVLIAVLASEE